MGVKDLWQLLSPVGRRVSIETLEGKTLAIDVSIWITQFIKSMRDENGKMMKNAHIIGTLRRILKLLFHRIRPLFVFDGATPTLKLRTINARRKTHDLHDANKKVSVQRILLAQLRQHRLNVTTDDQNSVVSSSKTNLSANFVPLCDITAGSDTLQSDEDNIDLVENNEVQWVSGGYDNLAQKKQMEEEEEIGEVVTRGRGGRRHGAESDEEGDHNFGWSMPDDHNDLSAEALEAMPTHIRKSLIEEARRRERARSRASYLPVAANPDLYSQTQLANFLNTSKLNQRFASVQQAVDKQSVGRVIASDGDRKFTLEAREEKPEGNSSDVSRNTEFCLNLPDSSGDEDSVGSYFMHSDQEEEEGEHDTSLAWLLDKPAAVESVDDNTQVRISSDGNNDLVMGRINNNNDATSTSVVVDRPRRVIVLEDEEEEDEEAEMNGSDERVAEGIDFARYANMDEAPETVHGFYENLHNDELDNDEEDVDWQSAEESEKEEEITTQTTESVHGDSPLRTEEHSLTAFQNVSNEVVDISGGVGGRFDHRTTSSKPDANSSSSNDNRSSSNNSSSQHDQYQRAVQTAASMADWAGRAVRSALREHMGSSQQQGGQEGGDTDQPVAAFVAPVSFDDNVPFPSSSSSSSSSFVTSGWEPVISLVDSHASFSSSSAQTAPHPAWAHHPPQFTSIEEERQWEVNEERSARRALASAQRDTESLTEEMKADVLQLLRAFDLPYIVAPFEAEAQCCVLEQLGLVDGVVTEDSDAFLFGAQAVYRHIFNDKKFVEVYYSSDVQQELGLSREDLVAFAYFLGSDYTEGVNGVGIVNAVEILQAFPMRSEAGGPVAGLKRFRAWLEGFDAVQAVRSQFDEGTSDRRKRFNKEDDEEEEADELRAQVAMDDEVKLLAFQRKHQNGRSKWSVPASFPNEQVASSYLHPAASRDTDQFRWTVPDVGRIRQYCAETLGWTKSEMDQSIDPVIAKYCERSIQTRIDSHFLAYRDDSRFAKIASDRLRTAVVQITGKRTNLALSGRRPAPAKRNKTAKVLPTKN